MPETQKVNPMKVCLALAHTHVPVFVPSFRVASSLISNLSKVLLLLLLFVWRSACISHYCLDPDPDLDLDLVKARTKPSVNSASSLRRAPHSPLLSSPSSDIHDAIVLHLSGRNGRGVGGQTRHLNGRKQIPSGVKLTALVAMRSDFSPEPRHQVLVLAHLLSRLRSRRCSNTQDQD